MSWDKIIEKMMNLDPKIAVRFAILDRQMSQGQVPPERIEPIIEEMNKLADAVLLDFDGGSVKNELRSPDPSDISPGVSVSFSGGQCSGVALDPGGVTYSSFSFPSYGLTNQTAEPPKSLPPDSPKISTTE